MFLGIDTSNYTTSVAVYDAENGSIISKKRLLPVDGGEVGLMQSKALFHHIRQLPAVAEAAFSSFQMQPHIDAVCVSDKPRNVDGSYMPVFTAGVCSARTVAAALGVPCYTTCHQNGHIVAALFSAGRLDLLKTQFIAFHVSGGTTEALLITPDKDNIICCEIIGETLDLNAGQIIDRAGVKMGLSFPSGKYLDEMAQNGSLPKKVKTCIKGNNCCLSGVENQVEDLITIGTAHNDIARYVIEFIFSTICEMTNGAKKKYGDLPVLYAGGVMSNSIISQRLSDAGGIFANPEFSADNAAGVAIIGKMLHSREKV